jgi:hypothetical protein
MMKRFMEQLDVIINTIRFPTFSGVIKKELAAERLRGERIEKEVFAFAPKA